MASSRPLYAAVAGQALEEVSEGGRALHEAASKHPGARGVCGGGGKSVDRASGAKHKRQGKGGKWGESSSYAQPPPSRKTIQVLELLALGAK